jgi:outer membrane protein TolC
LEVTSAENAVALSRVTLNEAMGIDVRTDYTPAIPAPPDPVALTLDQLIDAALSTRPEVLAAEADIKAAQASLALASKGLSPTINGGASYGLREDTFPPRRDH